MYVHIHRRQTRGFRGFSCTCCFFGLVVSKLLNKSRILLNKSQILILHPHFSGPFGANGHIPKKIHLAVILHEFCHLLACKRYSAWLDLALMSFACLSSAWEIRIGNFPKNILCGKYATYD